MHIRNQESTNIRRSDKRNCAMTWFSLFTFCITHGSGFLLMWSYAYGNSANGFNPNGTGFYVVKQRDTLSEVLGNLGLIPICKLAILSPKTNKQMVVTFEGGAHTVSGSVEVYSYFPNGSANLEFNSTIQKGFAEYRMEQSGNPPLLASLDLRLSGRAFVRVDVLGSNICLVTAQGVKHFDKMNKRKLECLNYGLGELPGGFSGSN